MVWSINFQTLTAPGGIGRRKRCSPILGPIPARPVCFPPAGENQTNGSISSSSISSSSNNNNNNNDDDDDDDDDNKSVRNPTRNCGLNVPQAPTDICEAS